MPHVGVNRSWGTTTCSLTLKFFSLYEEGKFLSGKSFQFKIFWGPCTYNSYIYRYNFFSSISTWVAALLNHKLKWQGSKESSSSSSTII